MSLIHGGDDIAKVIAEADREARQGYASAQQSFINHLRSELAAERTAKLNAEGLATKYAGLIGQQREELLVQQREAATPQGVIKAIRALPTDSTSIAELRAIIAALVVLADGMDDVPLFGTDVDTSLIGDFLEKAHDACDKEIARIDLAAADEAWRGE